MSFVQELRRRNVVRVGIAYAIAAWLLLQIIDVVVPIIEAPEWVPKAMLLLIAVGFPLSLLFAWAFELTPDGLKFERDVDRSQSITPTTGQRIDRAIIGVLVIAVILFAADKFIWSAVSDESGATDKRSIAVIPFINMSDEPDQVFFSDGISEEILNTLVRAEGISVASRTSSFSYRNHEQNIPVIAEELGVLFILEGSVRKSGNQLRITAQLIDAQQDRHLWSQTYDRGLTDVFAVQTDIANSITKAIRHELGIKSEAEFEVKQLTENMTAYDLYLQGTLTHKHRQDPQDLIDSRMWLEQAVEVDPNFAVAWEALAAVYATVPYWRIVDRSLEEYIHMSNEAAERALQLDPTLAYARGIIGSNRSAVAPYDQIGAVANYEAALEADPKNTTILNWYGMALQSAGYFEEGLALQQDCFDLDPGYANCAYFIESGLVLMDRPNEAMAFADRYVGILNGVQTSLVRAILFVKYGNRSAAFLSADDVVGFDDAPILEFITALESPETDNSPGLRKFDKWAAENDVNLADSPELLAAFGANDRVDIKIAAEPWFWFPRFREYRQSAEFAANMRNYGFYDLWKVKGFPPQCRPVGDDDFECD
jgi:TolB-like protein/Tfp pilus assembly protein PilF